MSPARAELFRALAVLAEPPGPGHAHVAHALALGDVPEESVYTRLFLFELYPYASVYVGAEGKLGGEAGSKIGGFWAAVGRIPPAEPDHLSALLGLHAALLAEAWEAPDAEAGLIAQGARALMHEHLAPWCFAYLERVQDLDGGFYSRWATLLERTLEEHVGASGVPASLPVHLRAAPGLPDPRDHGAGPFLDGLLAPVRSGMILTRTDLARLAKALGLGLRVGERRYVLEHLLAQDPGGVLTALAEAASAAGERHARRQPHLGVVADFWSQRAHATAELLGALSDVGPG